MHPIPHFTNRSIFFQFSFIPEKTENVILCAIAVCILKWENDNVSFVSLFLQFSYEQSFQSDSVWGFQRFLRFSGSAVRFGIQPPFLFVSLVNVSKQDFTATVTISEMTKMVKNGQNGQKLHITASTSFENNC